MATMELLMDRLPELLSIGMDAPHDIQIDIMHLHMTLGDNLNLHINSFPGQLTGWDLSNDEIFLLKAILKSGNSCLTLSPANVYS